MSGVCNKPQQVTMLSPPYQRPKVLPPCGGASARCRGRLTPLLVAGHLSTATRSSERPRQQTIRPHPPDPPPAPRHAHHRPSAPPGGGGVARATHHGGREKGDHHKPWSSSPAEHTRVPYGHHQHAPPPRHSQPRTPPPRPPPRGCWPEPRGHSHRPSTVRSPEG